jgi:hypothetical protein
MALMKDYSSKKVKGEVGGGRGGVAQWQIRK